MNRYEALIKHLDKVPLKNRRICPATGACACIGCAGMVGSKLVTQRELDMYLSGELQTKLMEEMK